MRHCYLVLDSNCKRFYAGVSSVGPVSGVHALALVHDVAGIHAIESVSSDVSPTVTASMLLSLLMLLLAPMHLLVFLRLLALLLLALLHYECCSMMYLLLLFSHPYAGKVFRTLRVPRRKPFAFPSAGKFWSLELCKVSLQRPDFYGMEECKMSHSRDRKTFPAFGNAKGLLPGTRIIFVHGECK
jgi:hypothetical protein